MINLEPDSLWLGHIKELRRCLLKSLVFFAVILLCLLPFAPKIYSLFAYHLIQMDQQQVAIKIWTPFSIPIRLTCLLALFLSLPYMLYQLWSFVAPGLYPQEKRWVLPLVLLSMLLFALGMFFAYAVVLPLFFGFLQKVIPAGVTMMPDMEHYWSFALGMFLSFGLAFQVPVVVVTAYQWRWISLESLAAGRRYFVVAAFIVSAFLTPPDILSQILMAVPLCLLYECGLWMCRLRSKPAKLCLDASE